VVGLCEKYYHVLKHFGILWLFLPFYLKYTLISIVGITFVEKKSFTHCNPTLITVVKLKNAEQ